MKNSYTRYLGIGPKLCQAGLAPAGDEYVSGFRRSQMYEYRDR